MAISYANKDAQTIEVKLDGKLVGRIVESRNGFRYFPNGHKNGGEFYKTLAECKISLESFCSTQIE